MEGTLPASLETFWSFSSVWFFVSAKEWSAAALWIEGWIINFLEFLFSRLGFRSGSFLFCWTWLVNIMLLIIKWLYNLFTLQTEFLFATQGRFIVVSRIFTAVVSRIVWPIVRPKWKRTAVLKCCLQPKNYDLVTYFSDTAITLKTCEKHLKIFEHHVRTLVCLIMVNHVVACV